VAHVFQSVVYAPVYVSGSEKICRVCPVRVFRSLDARRRGKLRDLGGCDPGVFCQ
jgi:hypothetical protein